jgi:hypothetical protein
VIGNIPSSKDIASDMDSSRNPLMAADEVSAGLVAV